MGWSKGQVRDFVLDVKRDPAWPSSLVTDEFRRCLLAKRFAAIVTNQMIETLKSQDVADLWTNMLREAGLLADGKPL